MEQLPACAAYRPVGVISYRRREALHHSNGWGVGASPSKILVASAMSKFEAISRGRHAAMCGRLPVGKGDLMFC